MKEKKLIKDIYRLLDGELSPGERDELEQYLAGHPEAAKIFNQCEKVKKQLEELPKVEVDPEIKATVLDRIYTTPQAQPKQEIGFSFIQDFWQRPAFKLSFIFVAGVFVGFLVFSFFQTDFSQYKSNKDNLKGTFSSPRSFDDLKMADAVLFENAQVKAVCNARYSANNVEIHLDLSSGQMLTSILEFDLNNFSVYNIQPIKVNNQSSTLVASNSVNINNIGDNKYIILLYNKKTQSHDISFRLLQNGQQLYQSAITINK